MMIVVETNEVWSAGTLDIFWRQSQQDLLTNWMWSMRKKRAKDGYCVFTWEFGGIVMLFAEGAPESKVH